MQIGLSLSLTAPRGRPLGPELKATGTTGLVGVATAASYNTTTGAGSVSRAADANNQSWVQFSGLTTGATYRLSMGTVSGPGVNIRHTSQAGVSVVTVPAGSGGTYDLTLPSGTSLFFTNNSNNNTTTFTVVSLRQVL